jgi:cytochrome c
MMLLIATVMAGTSVATIPVAWGQDAAAGEKLFVKCKSCHQVGLAAKNASGPELNGLFGRAAGSIPDFNYSPAMKAAGFAWDAASFAAFLQDPKAKVPGTKMMAGQIKDAGQIADLAAYLKTFDASGQKQ